jgi:hypothetical protein
LETGFDEAWITDILTGKLKEMRHWVNTGGSAGSMRYSDRWPVISSQLKKRVLPGFQLTTGHLSLATAKE